MPTISQLQYIVSVNKLKHFGQAAKECHVSQPSLSAQIKKVEDELNMVIFDRSKKPLMLTEPGQKFIEQAQIVLREHRKLFDIVSDTQEPSGNFYLGVIPTLSPYVIPLFLEKFSKQNPKVNLKIEEFKTNEIIEKLHHDELDAGLLVTPLKDEQIIEHRLFYEPFYVFVANDHPYRARKTIAESELDPRTLWLLNEGHCFREQVMRVCAFPKGGQILDNVTFASGNLETIINLIRKGHGYTLLPYLCTLNLSDAERLSNLKKFATPVPAREVSLVYRRTFLKEKIINALQGEILANIPQQLKSFKRESVEVIDI